MNTISSAALAAVLFAVGGCAQAADLAVTAPPPAAAFDWTGFYVGAQAGYGWGRDKTVEYLTGTNTQTGLFYRLNSHGLLGGGFAGANYQMNSIVLGAEADLEAADIHGHFDDPAGLGAGSSRIDWDGSVRARLGYAGLDRSLIYVTGGVAFANINYVYSRLFTVPPVNEPITNFRTGWTLGAGFEYALTNNLTLRSEYRYADYGTFRDVSNTAFGPGVLGLGTPGLTGRQHPTTSTVRIGIAYKF